MLCTLEDDLPTGGLERLRVSSGTAVVLGLDRGLLQVAPTTAYLMLGGRCQFNCAFCAQGRESASSADQLSRVVWPEYAMADVLERLAKAHAAGAIERCCIQVTASPGVVGETLYLVERIASACRIPLCVCIRARSLTLVEHLLKRGVERVTLALDAANDAVYNRIKGSGFQQTVQLLWQAAARYPSRIGTHLIVGLGESEEDLARVLQAAEDRQVMTGLFAFTPVPGTALADQKPPPLVAYRRVQAARYLILGHHTRLERMTFDTGRIVSYGVDRERLFSLLCDGEAFRTSGCPGCNRPYYNEHPQGPLYNYPRPLTAREGAEAASMVVESLTDS